MKSNGLKTNEVVARGDGRRNSGRPRRVVGNHLAVTPLTIVDCTTEKTGFIDFELYTRLSGVYQNDSKLINTYPFKGACVRASAARSGALSEIGKLLDQYSSFDRMEKRERGNKLTMGPIAWGQTWFQYAVIAEPAATVAVSWRAPAVPSSLQARVGSVASWIGLLL